MAELELSNPRLTIQPFGALVQARSEGIEYYTVEWDREWRAGLRFSSDDPISRWPVRGSWGFSQLCGLLETEDTLTAEDVVESVQLLRLPRLDIPRQDLRILADLYGPAIAGPVEGLDLTGGDISDEDLAQLNKWPETRILLLAYCRRIGDAGLAHLEQLPELEVLDLSRTRVTDAGLEQLEGLPKLKALLLAETRLSDAGLVHLTRLPGLEHLNLRATNVTDEGIAQLDELRTLKTLWLGETSVSDQAVLDLKRELPGLSCHREDPPWKRGIPVYR